MIRKFTYSLLTINRTRSVRFAREKEPFGGFAPAEGFALLLILFFTIICSNIGISDDVIEWKQDLVEDYQRVLKAKRFKLKRHRGLVSKWHEREHLHDLIDLYEETVAKSDADASVYYGLGYAYFTKAQVRRASSATPAIDENALNLAVKNFSQSITLAPGSLLAHFSLAGTYTRQDKYSEAIKQYRNCLELDDEYYKAHYEIGEIYRRQKKYDKALSEYKKAGKIEKKWIPPFYSMGLIYLDRNNTRKAKIALEYVIKLEEEHPLAHFKLGQVYAKEGKVSDALKEYDVGAKYNPPNAEILYELGKVFADTGKDSYALIEFQKAIEVNPDCAPAYFQMGEIYYAKGDNAKALEHYQTAIRSDSRLEGYFLRQFDKVGEIRRIAPTSQVYRKAIQLEPGLENVFFKRAKEAFSQGDFNGAAEKFDKHSLIYPQDASTQYWLGRCYDKLEDFDQSLEYYLLALELEPTHQESLIELARNYQRREETQKMMAEIKNDPEAVEAYQQLGYLYNSYTIELNEAKKTLEKALELDPKHVRTLLNYGNALYNMGETGLAVEQFELAVQIEPKNLTANYNLALMYERTGKRLLAIARWKKFLELGPPAQWRVDAIKHLEKLQSK